MKINYFNSIQSVSNQHKARSFGSTFRFMDDLCAINDKGLFPKHLKEIYPEEQELKKENLVSTKALLLDIDLKIKDNKNVTILYD